MTTSIPDSISTSALEDLMTEATPETPVATMANATNEEKIAFVVDKIEDLTDEFGTVFSYKLIADYCIYKLYDHHNSAYSRYFSEGNEATALCWARDAGHFQVMGTTLRNILTGPDDFMAPSEDVDCDGNDLPA
jgi:hypothetical protein